MAIIIEGMDATGKSTLAHLVASHFNLQVQESEGPARSLDEIAHRISRYRGMIDTIFVRHPCVSQNIYNVCRPNDPIVINPRDFYELGHTFIYCAPAHQTQIPKAHEDPEFISAIERYRPDLIRLYNEWAIRHAHIIYRIGDDPRRVIDLLGHTVNPDLVADIRDFHQRFAIEYSGPPRHLPADLYEFREKFLKEEAAEYADAPDLAHRFDALIDSVYVAIGSSHLHGFDFYEGWRRVHHANMLKVRAQRAEDSLRNSTHDVVKPPGWRPPDLEDLCT